MGLAAYGAVSCNDGSDKSRAAAMVDGVDAVVLVVGLTSEGVKGGNDEAEGHDRSTLVMPAHQDALVAAVSAAAATKKIPVTLVVMGGGVVDMKAEKASAAIGAIMWCGYPGQSGGASIADAIFGKVNPAGKLTLTWYDESFAKAVPITDYGMRPDKATGNPGRTYRFYTGTPVFKFGEGLSYTTFEHELAAPATLFGSHFQADLTLSGLSKVTAATVTVAATNTGGRPGDSVVLVFAAPPGAGANGRPLRSLVAFDRVSLAQGETKSISLDINAQHFALAGADATRAVVKGAWRVWVGADGEDSAQTITIA